MQLVALELWSAFDDLEYKTAGVDLFLPLLEQREMHTLENYWQSQAMHSNAEDALLDQT